MFTVEGEMIEEVAISAENEVILNTGNSVEVEVNGNSDCGWLSKWVPFKPRNFNLPEDFQFRNFSCRGQQGLKDGGFEIPIKKNFMEHVLSDFEESESMRMGEDSGHRLSVEEALGIYSRTSDVSVFSVTRHEPTLQLVEVENVVYSCVDDPYLTGRIAFVQLLASFYALGIYEMDNILMILMISNKLKTEEQDVVIPLMIEGFRDVAAEVGLRIGGGHTCINPWVGIGGVLTTAIYSQHFLAPVHATEGDVLVITKPLGIETVLAAYEIRFSSLKSPFPDVSDDDLISAYQMALHSMTYIDSHAARLMRKYGAHGGMAIRSCGLLGHANKLAMSQVNPVDLVFYNLPIFSKADKFSRIYPASKLMVGLDQEVSGGLLIILPKENALKFSKELEQIQGTPAWMVGVVRNGSRTAKLSKYPRIIPVDFPKIFKQ